jgi:8-oxo-dGTP pyrophosphatase MutT (NUDIX family)
MGYIEELRQRIGHRPLIMVGATVLLRDQQGRLLMLRRTDNHCWGVPGGALELGETLEEVARRETFEETGLKLTDLTLFGVFSGPELYYRYPSGDEVFNVSVVYTAQCPADELVINAEHSRFQFFDLADLPEAISPPIVKIIAQLRKEG